MVCLRNVNIDTLHKGDTEDDDDDNDDDNNNNNNNNNVPISLKLKHLHFAHTTHLYIQYDSDSEQHYFLVQNSHTSALMEAQRVLCEVRTQSLCTIWIRFSLQGVKNLYIFFYFISSIN
jgi:hypothetical protein